MTAPPTGEPPECKVPAPAQEPAPATTLTATDSSRSVAERARRRGASRRLAILDSGRSDPWRYDEVPVTDHQRECWQRTVAHLTAAGFRAIIPTDILVGLR